MNNPFRYFNSSPEVICLAVMRCIRYPLSLRQVEDILFERGIDICHATVRFRWNRFGPMSAGEIRRRRVHDRNGSNWRWNLDEVFVLISGETHYLWRAVDHEGEVLAVFCHEAAGSPSRTEVPEAHDETDWTTVVNRYRPASILSSCDEGAGKSWAAGMRALAQQ